MGALGEARASSRPVMELCRVAREVRIVPLLALGGAPSPFIEGCVRLPRGSRAYLDELGWTSSATTFDTSSICGGEILGALARLTPGEVVHVGG